jgi:hypothetical protein
MTPSPDCIAFFPFRETMARIDNNNNNNNNNKHPTYD